jgi:hypothetical protein
MGNGGARIRRTRCSSAMLLVRLQGVEQCAMSTRSQEAWQVSACVASLTVRARSTYVFSVVVVYTRCVLVHDAAARENTLSAASG